MIGRVVVRRCVSRFSSSCTAAAPAATAAAAAAAGGGFQASKLTLLIESGTRFNTGDHSAVTYTYTLCEGIDVKVTRYPKKEKTGLRKLISFRDSEESGDRFAGLSYGDTELEYTHERGYSSSVSAATRDPTSNQTGECLVLAGLGGFVVKEIAIPVFKSKDDNDEDKVCLHSVLLQSLGARAYGRGQIPGLYVLPMQSGDVTLRLVPISRMLITLKVQDIAAAKDALSCGGRVEFEEVGGKPRYAEEDKSTAELHILDNVFDDPIQKGGSEGEGQASKKSTPQAQDISVRICEHDTIHTFFNEASFSVTEGTIKAIQSDRVYGGPPTLVESKFGYAGDCWVEFWEMAKEKTKEVVLSLQKPLSSSSSSSSTVRIDKSTRKPVVSRAPSIVE